MKNRLFLIPVLTLIQSGYAQNTGGVFGPIVNDNYSAVQYRSAFDTQTNRLSQRIHFEKSINGDLMWRAVYGTRKTDHSDYDFDFFQAELFWELSDDTDYLRTGFRFDLHLVDDDRPNFLGVNWMSQINLNETWSCRFLAMSSFDFGENARDGVFLQARASVTCHVTEHLSLGAEFYDSYGSTDHLLRFADQNLQLGPVANYTFDNNFSLYGGVMYGLTEQSPDSQLRLWLTRTF